MPLLIVIPTYNEVENLGSICDAIWQELSDTHILVVDDNSTDGTKGTIRSLLTRHPSKFFALERPGKLGLGTAYVAGFKWALSRDYQHIIQMDADFSHPVDRLPAMAAAVQNTSVVIGSRYVAGGKVTNWGVIRQLISRFGSLYARTILGLNIRDLTGGFNAWQAPVLRSISLDSVRSEGYSFQIELKFRAARKGHLIKEIPIEFKDRRAGHSKMSGKIIIEAMLRVWTLRSHLKHI